MTNGKTTLRKRSTTVLLAAALGLGLVALAPGGSSLPPPVWLPGGPNSSWDYVPLSGWATNHAGNYNNNECSFVESLPLPLLLDTELAFTHEFNIEYASFSGYAYDAGVVLVSDGQGGWIKVNPGYNTVGYSTSFGLQNCLDAEYGIGSTETVFSGIQPSTTATVDLADYGFAVGDLLSVRFLLGTDSSVLRPGWNIESVSLGGVAILL